jgi:hypothetical protein
MVYSMFRVPSRKFKHDFGEAYYLHAKSDQAAAILENIQYRRTANGKNRPTGPFDNL